MKVIKTAFMIFDSLRKLSTFREAITVFPAKWRVRNERRNSIPMTYHYPDLGKASDWSYREENLLQPITSNAHVWEVYVISMELACTQTLFCFSYCSFRKHRGARERARTSAEREKGKIPAVYVLSPALDRLWRENRRSVKRLVWNFCSGLF